MDSLELQRRYGDSHTLDRPSDDDLISRRPRRPATAVNPLDDPTVVDAAIRQGWGN